MIDSDDGTGESKTKHNPNWAYIQSIYIKY